MESRVQAAVARKASMNCAQAITVTYADLAGLTEEQAMNLAKGFGSGVGGTMQGTCGAITGAAMIVGLANPDMSKAEVTQRVGTILKEFEAKNGSSICKTIKGVDTGNVLRSCPGCVEDAAILLEQILQK